MRLAGHGKKQNYNIEYRGLKPYRDRLVESTILPLSRNWLALGKKGGIVDSDDCIT
jgi:hypothetical protein